MAGTLPCGTNHASARLIPEVPARPCWTCIAIIEVDSVVVVVFASSIAMVSIFYWVVDRHRVAP